MIMEADKSIYNLRIHNSQLDDEAEYQCQVGPAFKQQAIRASSRLTVIGMYRDEMRKKIFGHHLLRSLTLHLHLLFFSSTAKKSVHEWVHQVNRITVHANLQRQ